MHMRKTTTYTLLSLVIGLAALVAVIAIITHHRTAADTYSDVYLSHTSVAIEPIAASQVNIQNFSFLPQAITVKKGGTVTWQNKDTVAHSVTGMGSATMLNSSNLAPGASYNVTFDQPGTYNYQCNLYPGMTGTVIVTN